MFGVAIKIGDGQPNTPQLRHGTLTRDDQWTTKRVTVTIGINDPAWSLSA
jgi:hypothetical protein